MIESDSGTGKNCPFDICSTQGRLLGRIRVGEGCVRVRGTVQDTLKECGTENRGGKTKNFKKGEQAGSRGGCLKKEGARTPL